MASKNIVLKGATWNGVESIDLPVSGGGMARFVETSDSDAVASDVAQGKTCYVNGSKITGTASGGGGLEFETGTWEPTEDITRGTIYFLNQHDKPPAYYMISDCTNGEGLTANSNLSLSFTSIETINGQPYPYNASGNYFRYADWVATVENTNSATTQYEGNCGKSYNNPSTPTTNNYPRYWCDESAIYPNTGDTNRYWRAGRTYKWFALWM